MESLEYECLRDCGVQDGYCTGSFRSCAELERFTQGVLEMRALSFLQNLALHSLIISLFINHNPPLGLSQRRCQQNGVQKELLRRAPQEAEIRVFSKQDDVAASGRLVD